MSESRASRLAHRCGLAILGFSAALWAVTTAFFVGVWDHVAAITTFPQIWVKGRRAVSSHAIRTVHSDRRMVVTDVLLDSKRD